MFVTEFPRHDAKFYHHQNEKNPEVADRADMLFRGVEIITLTQREVEYDKLIQQIKNQKLDPNNPGLKHYLDAFKYGMPDEGGFGFGVARFVQKLIGLENAKEDAEVLPVFLLANAQSRVPSLVPMRSSAFPSPCHQPTIPGSRAAKVSR